MEPKTNEDWIAEYNKAIDQGFDVPSSWLRTLLTTRDAERDEAYKQGLKDGAVNPGERRRIIDQLRAEVRDEAVEAALLAAEKERVGHMRICYEAGKSAAKFDTAYKEVVDICTRYGIDLPPKDPLPTITK